MRLSSGLYKKRIHLKKENETKKIKINRNIYLPKKTPPFLKENTKSIEPASPIPQQEKNKLDMGLILFFKNFIDDDSFQQDIIEDFIIKYFQKKLFEFNDYILRYFQKKQEELEEHIVERLLNMRPALLNICDDIDDP